jgi:hypothetical protein
MWLHLKVLPTRTYSGVHSCPAGHCFTRCSGSGSLPRTAAGRLLLPEAACCCLLLPDAA